MDFTESLMRFPVDGGDLDLGEFLSDQLSDPFMLHVSVLVVVRAAQTAAEGERAGLTILARPRMPNLQWAILSTASTILNHRTFIVASFTVPSVPTAAEESHRAAKLALPVNVDSIVTFLADVRACTCFDE